MNKKLLWSLCLAALSFTVFTGCQKFLERKPLTATLEDLNQGGLEGQIFGLYGAIRNTAVAGDGFGSIASLALHNFRSDDSEKGSSASDGADWGVIYDEFKYVKDHWSSTIYWDQHYVLISLANTALQTADSLNLSAPADMVNRAEARFFRALAYFDLVRTYGQVPKIDFRVYNPQDANKPKAPVAEIYALIDADLEFAMQHLPLNWNNAAGQNRFPGRLTSGAAKSLAAKTKLYRQDWATALALTQQVISSNQYTLEPEFAKIWTNAGENGVESIFEIQSHMGANRTDDYTNNFARAQGVRGAGDWDLGWGWNTPTQNLVDAFPANDKRKDATILFSGQNDGYGRVLPAYPTIPRRYWNKKVHPEPTMQTFTGERQGAWINQRILRYADVLLMAAEAANEVGGAANETLAVNLVNQIRKRAGLADIAFTSKAQMRTAIQNERRLELALEGERFFDLVRWGLAESVLGAQGYQAKNRYYPIPQSAIDRSNNVLVQNPDY